jgi:hypothetical protein
MSSLIAFLVLPCTVFAQNYIAATTTSPTFKERVIMPPDVAFLWDFQRGVEEIYRFAKFTSVLRIGYSLELLERRIGEMDVLVNESEGNYIQLVENEYEIELQKVYVEMNTTDIFSQIMENNDIKENVTQRLQYDTDVLDFISKETPEPYRTSVNDAIKKTDLYISLINNL